MPSVPVLAKGTQGRGGHILGHFVKLCHTNSFTNQSCSVACGRGILSPNHVHLWGVTVVQCTVVYSLFLSNFGRLWNQHWECWHQEVTSPGHCRCCHFADEGVRWSHLGWLWKKSPGVLRTTTTRPFHCIQQPHDVREPSSEQTQPRTDPKGALKTLVWKTQGDFCTCLQYVLSADLTGMNSLRELQRFPNKGSYPFRITHEKHCSPSLWVTPGCRAKRNQTPPAQLGEGVPCLWCLWLQTAFLFLTPEKTFCRESLFLFALLLSLRLLFLPLLSLLSLK